MLINKKKVTFDLNKQRYTKYFSLHYLLKYGYFDFKYSSKDIKEDYILSNIVYKKVFNMDDLVSVFKEVQKQVSFKSRVDTTPMEISIYKNENERRNFKLPNLYSYICLCIHLSDNQDKYVEVLNSSSKSLSKEFYNTTFLQGKIKREENRIGKKNIFKTDIQNFYPSLYTHSIPWILVGKSVAKRNKKNYKEYYNQLDSLIQRCQRGETHGLPTGSFAFRLIAEIYMCKLDIKMEKHPYIRYVDDFELPFNDESEKSEFYKELNKELSILNLKIKIEKNQVDTFPFEGDNNSAFFFDYFLNFSDENLKNQSQRIYNFIDSCIYKEREGYKGSLKLMFKALKSSILKGEILQKVFSKSLFKKLFNMVLMTPHLSVYFLELVDVLEEFIQNNLKKCIEEIKPQIQMNIDRYIDLNYNQELYSLLSIFYYLNINSIFNVDTLLQIIENMDDLSAILSFELILTEENNIDNFLFETIEKKLENSVSWQDEYWFFKYHVILRINKDKKSKLFREYKNYLYKKYNNGINKSKFFNQSNIRKIKSSINVAWQHTNSDQDISKFFNLLLEKKVCFIK
ncbi:RNA-directed DNA polymerase [Bacillus paralicheniformis]|uniref:Reverse transcriptase domain-containing protein n=4 Tax=Bacillus subtilis group TaxID=653685 RepID=A0A7Z0WYZ3_9BACI|nr:RNA-directed DNA polymerase [Bacillus paralicheniformis]MBC8622032.1 RNA-directed DNA polymerase [Robertmurraya crescens]OLF95647.1 hypothetical protein B4121_1209 [Bacillus paralicheniformis]